MERVRVSAETAVQIIKNGGMLILTDDETRENEGDLVVASEFITAEHINFMAKYGKGLICVSLPAERCDELQLSAMVQENTCKFGTAFTVSVEAREGVTTGISAYDRAVTIKTLINPNATFRDIVTPGHMFPLRAKKGGVLVRAGQTEGSYDLARMAGLYPSGVICEIMDDDGSMARMPRLVEFAKEHNIKIVTVADLIKYRLEHEPIVQEIETALMPSAYGSFSIKGFLNTSDEKEAVAIIKGDISGYEPVYVRVHSQCLTGDIFASSVCGCGTKLHNALHIIEQKGRGVVLYIYKDTSKTGFLSSPEGMLSPHSPNETNAEGFGFGAMCLRMLGLKKIKLLGSSPKTLNLLASYGLEIVE